MQLIKEDRAVVDTNRFSGTTAAVSESGHYERYKPIYSESLFREELRQAILVALPRETLFVGRKSHQQLAERLIAQLRPGDGITVRLLAARPGRTHSPPLSQGDTATTMKVATK